MRRTVVLRAFRYSLLLATPGAAAAALAGGPVVTALMPSRVGSSGGMFGTDILLMVPLLITTLGVWATMPALLSTPGGLSRRRVGALVIGLLVIHAAATLVGRALWGFDGAVLAMAVAPLAFTCIALQIAAPGTAVLLLRPTLTICCAAAVSFGLLAVCVHPLLQAHGAAAAIIAAIVGVAAYAVLVSRTNPDETRTIARLAMR